jgi:hypothetical protein
MLAPQRVVLPGGTSKKRVPVVIGSLDIKRGEGSRGELQRSRHPGEFKVSMYIDLLIIRSKCLGRCNAVVRAPNDS